MATAVPVTLAGPSGATIYGGQFAPAQLTGSAPLSSVSASGGLSSPAGPASATLAVSANSASTGGSVSVSVTLNTVADQTYVATLTKTGSAVLGSPTITILSGQVSGSTTLANDTAETVFVSLTGVAPSLTVAGSPKSVTFSSAPADWTTRSSAPSVVWRHRFDSDTEITKFLSGATAGGGHAGNAILPFRVADQTVGNAMRFIALGGRLAADFPASGGAGPRPLVLEDDYLWPDPAVKGNYYVHLCKPNGGQTNNLLHVTAKTGTTLTVTYVAQSGQPFSNTQQDWVIGDHIGHQCAANWVRIFSALKAGDNGLAADDINNAGTTLRDRTDATNFPHGAQAFGYGWYGHPDEQAAHATWRPSDHGVNGIDSVLRSNLWDGEEFEITWRQRVDPSFLTLAASIDPNSEDNRFGRKCWMLQAEMTVPQQITSGYAPSNRYWIPTTLEPPFAIGAYSFAGGLAGRRIAANLDGTGTYQPGSAWASTALPNSFVSAGAAWENPAGEWVAFKLRVKPGHRWEDTNPSATGVRDTLVEMKVCRQADAAWTTVVSQTDQAIVFGSSGPVENVWTSALPGYSAMALSGYLNTELGSVPPKRSYYFDFGEVIFAKRAAGSSELAPPAALMPAWMPSPGRVAVLNTGNSKLTNTFASQVPSHYAPFYSKKIRNDYSGAAVNPSYGALGSVIFEGGGHAATNDNSIIQLEAGLSACTFRRLLTGTNWFPGSPVNNDIGNISGLFDTTWCEANADGKPLSRHSYGDAVVLGPEHGGAAYGSLMFAFSSGGHLGFIPTNMHSPHALAISGTTGEAAWSRACAAPNSWGDGNSPFYSAHVPAQRRIYVHKAHVTQIRWQNRLDRSFGLGTGTPLADDTDSPGGGAGLNGGRLLAVPARHLLLFADRKGGNLRIRRMSVGLADTDPSWVNGASNAGVTLSASIPIGYDWSHICWCPENRRLIVGAVSGDPDCVYEIAIPDTLTNTWTATRVAFTGGDVIAWAGGNAYGAWDYLPNVRGIPYMPVAVDSGSDAVYAYRPTGT